jgi:hypothetical protein
MWRSLTLSAILLVGTGGIAVSHETSTDPSIVLESGGFVAHDPNRTQDVLLIETTTTALGQALTDLSVTYDSFLGDDFSAVDLSPYVHVFVAMDGGLVEAPSLQNAANYVNAGGCLHFYGGTCWQPYAQGLNTYLLQNDVHNYCWATVGGSPHSTVVDAGHHLAADLPATYSFADIFASYYQTRNTDGVALVAAANGDGYDHLFSKWIGSGHFDYCTNSPYIYYYSNPNDYAWLRTVVRNMVTNYYCGGIPPVAVRNASWGAIKAIYR